MENFMKSTALLVLIEDQSLEDSYYLRVNHQQESPEKTKISLSLDLLFEWDSLLDENGDKLYKGGKFSLLGTVQTKFSFFTLELSKEEILFKFDSKLNSQQKTAFKDSINQYLKAKDNKKDCFLLNLEESDIKFKLNDELSF